jgi:hypothetical protein
MAETQLIPQIDSGKVQMTLGALEGLKALLLPLESDAKSLKVENATDYETGGLLLKRIRDNRKEGTWIMAPLKAIAKTITECFRTAELAHANKCEQLESIVETKLVDFKRRERAAAEAEEKRINEERRRDAERLAELQRKEREAEIKLAQKSGEIGKREAARQTKEAVLEADALKNTFQTVTVEPSTPKIAGLRQRVVWHWEAIDTSKIPRAFLCPDEKLIGQYVRTAKDAALCEKAIPGIRVWSEDCI